MVIEPDPRETASSSDRRVEIVHESLLSKWPRLVRWRAQDVEGAQLRDELRQAAQLWAQHDRSEDLLWTGATYREFQVWRDRYPGGLTRLEEAFAAEMASLAGRRRRRRRVMVATAFAALVAVLAVVGVSRQQAIAGARHADAANLVSLGQLALQANPSMTVAHAIASLELADNPAARRLALEALWRGPTALVASDERSWDADFTPDGRALVQGGENTGRLRLFRADGSSALLEHEHDASWISIDMGLETDVFFSSGYFVEPPSRWLVSLWSAGEGRSLGSWRHEEPGLLAGLAVDARRRRGVYLVLAEGHVEVHAIGFDGEHRNLGALGFEFTENAAGQWSGLVALDPRAGGWIGATQGEDVYVVEVGERELAAPRHLGRQAGVERIACDPRGRFFATAGGGAEIRLWSLRRDAPPIVLESPPPGTAILRFTSDGSWLSATAVEPEHGDETTRVWSLEGDSPRDLGTYPWGRSGIGSRSWDPTERRYARSGPDRRIRLWSMAAPPDADPVFLLRGEVDRLWRSSFHPGGRWLVDADRTGLALWPLARLYPVVLRAHEKRVYDVIFGPEGSWLASCSMDDTVRIWELDGEAPPAGRVLFRDPGAQILRIVRSGDGERILASTAFSGVHLLSLAGEELPAVPRGIDYFEVAALSPGGARAAGVTGLLTAEPRILVWDQASGEEIANLRPAGRTADLQFLDDEHLLVPSVRGLDRTELATGTSQRIFDGNVLRISASPTANRAIAIVEEGEKRAGFGRVVVLDLESGAATTLARHGTRVSAVALSQDGETVASGDLDGVVRVGTVAGEEPHLLLGHEGTIRGLAFDPRGRWIASGGFDATVRLWPMPDLSQPPLHALRREALIAKLKALTNYRVLRDSEAPTGWKLGLDPFPGWETVPTW